MKGRKKIAYFYDPNVGGYYYGAGHPMKPQRIRAAHELIEAYDLYRHLDVYAPRKARYHEICTFHDEDYVDFLSKVSPESMNTSMIQMKRFNVGHDTDCPVFHGIYDYQRSCSGASIEAAQRINAGTSDIVINW